MDTFGRDISRARNKAAGLGDMLPELVEEYVEALDAAGQGSQSASD